MVRYSATGSSVRASVPTRGAVTFVVMRPPPFRLRGMLRGYLGSFHLGHYRFRPAQSATNWKRAGADRTKESTETTENACSSLLYRRRLAGPPLRAAIQRCVM